MNVLKSLIGSVIGAALGIGVYFAIKNATGETYVWFPVVMGAVTGIVANLFYNKTCSTGTRFVCGALAALVAGIAIFGVELAPALMAEPAEYGPLDLSDRIVASNNDEQNEDEDDDSSSESTDSESTESESDGGESGGADAGSDKTDDGSRTTDNESDGSEDSSGETESGDAPPADAFSDRAKAPDRGAVDEAAKAVTSERFAELIKKQSHETWLDKYLPFILNGLGILLAYQFARGFGSAPKQ